MLAFAVEEHAERAFAGGKDRAGAFSISRGHVIAQSFKLVVHVAKRFGQFEVQFGDAVQVAAQAREKRELVGGGGGGGHGGPSCGRMSGAISYFLVQHIRIFASLGDFS